MLGTDVQIIYIKYYTYISMCKERVLLIFVCISVPTKIGGKMEHNLDQVVNLSRFVSICLVNAKIVFIRQSLSINVIFHYVWMLLE